LKSALKIKQEEEEEEEGEEGDEKKVDEGPSK
jgi:hypothetical protein